MQHPAADPLNYEIQKYLRALSNITRWSIVLMTIARPVQMHQILRALQIPKANLSHHLRVLEAAELVVIERRGIRKSVHATEVGAQLAKQVLSAIS